MQLGGEFRFLTASSHGQIEENFLPNDAIEHSDRAYVHFTDITNLAPGLRFDTDVASVSDSNYFCDFAVGADQTSVTFLERRAELLYYDDTWRIRAQLQNFQTIDTSIDAGDRPYSRVPRVEAYGLCPLFGDLEFALSSEVTNFLREVGPTGVRADLSPELRWSSARPGYFFEPVVGYHFTQYDLQNAAVRRSEHAHAHAALREPRHRTRSSSATPARRVSAPQTLEPRLVYTYVPYRNQNELPLFDTGAAGLEPGRVVPHQSLCRRRPHRRCQSAGLRLDHAPVQTSRPARRYLSATIGQIRYFTLPRVLLPDEITQTLPGPDAHDAPRPADGQLICPGRISQRLPGQTLSTAPQEIAAGLPRLGHRRRGLGDGLQELERQSRLPVESLHLADRQIGDPGPIPSRPHQGGQCRLPLPGQDILKQYDGSFAWPIAGHWNTVGRWVYSLQDQQTIEQLAGFEYKSCCWRIQVVQRRYLAPTGNGGLDTSIALQLELTGLSSVGKRCGCLPVAKRSAGTRRAIPTPE